MKNISALLFCLLLASGLRAQTDCLDQLDREIQFKLDSLRMRYNYPGFAMVVIQDTQTIYQKIYGVKRIHKPEAVSANTKFYWASVTKVFTATAIMQLYEQGKLELDDPVIKYYPEFNTKEGHYSSDSITIRHLLTHSSGLPKHLDNKLISNPCYDLPPKEGLKKLGRIELQFSPGTNYLYSNVGMVVLGVIIENVSGYSYEAYIQQHIFNPLQMNHSSLSENNNETDTSIAATHLREGDQYKESKRIYTRTMKAGGGLKASIEDMSSWMKACMQMGFDYQGVIMKPETFQKMWHDTLWCSDRDPNAYIQGYAWDCGQYKGKQFYAKGGNLEGQSSSYLILFEESKLGIAFVTNFNIKGWDEYILKMIDIVLDYERCKHKDL